MPIYLPESTDTIGSAVDGSLTPSVEALTPRQIVAALDKHVIAQPQAKRAVAIALRNRMRRQQLPSDLAEEVAPKNILMIGPTGVGKTEIARRLARLAQSPFIKVEASKFTEVGYVGRDVESMVRDLVELSVEMLREERLVEVQVRAKINAEERLLDLLLPPLSPSVKENDPGPARDHHQRTRLRLREQLSEGRLAEREVEVDVPQKGFPSFEVISGSSIEEIDINVKDMLPGLFQGKSRKRRTRRACGKRRSIGLNRPVSSSLTRSIRSPGTGVVGTDQMSVGKAYSVTSYRSWRVLRSALNMGWYVPITSCSSRPVRFTLPSPRISFRNYKGVSPYAWNWMRSKRMILYAF